MREYLRDPDKLPPEDMALEQFLMDQTLDYGMWLHHHYMETSHSRYATAIKFGQLIEEVEQEDVRMGKSPLVEGTGLKFPSWIRAAEALIPELEGLNAAQQAAELKWTEAELERVRNMIVEEGKAARQLVAVTDPFAGISPEEEPVAPEALEELFGDEDTLLPGVEIEIYSTEMMDELVGMSVADKRLQGMVSKENVVADSLRKLSAASGAPMAGASDWEFEGLESAVDAEGGGGGVSPSLSMPVEEEIEEEEAEGGDEVQEIYLMNNDDEELLQA